MDKFGDNWKGHQNRILKIWDRIVGDSDIVLIPGDLSWALKLEDAIDDLNWIARRPGTKIIIKGNHDYWWNSVSKIRKSTSDNMLFIQNNSIIINDIAFVYIYI